MPFTFESRKKYLESQSSRWSFLYEHNFSIFPPPPPPAGWAAGKSGKKVILGFWRRLDSFRRQQDPEFAKGLGQAMKEFKKASNDVSNEIHNAMNQETSSASAPRPQSRAPRSAAPAATVPKS
jgi:hypothetical protein